MCSKTAGLCRYSQLTTIGAQSPDQKKKYIILVLLNLYKRVSYVSHHVHSMRAFIVQAIFSINDRQLVLHFRDGPPVEKTNRSCLVSYRDVLLLSNISGCGNCDRRSRRRRVVT